MYDLHCHLIYGVDDGTLSLEDSLKLIKNAFDNGYKGLVLTPHYVLDSSYDSNVLNNKKILEELKSKIDYDMSLYLGNEVYFNREILSLLKKGEISTLNDSRYLLLELSVMNQDKNVLDVIDILKENGITPIIAHPERYSYLMKNLLLMVEMIEHGALFQVNIGSLVGLYGKTYKKNVIKLIKSNLIHFLSSDTHTSNNYSYVDKALDILSEINSNIGLELLSINPLKVIKDEEIIPNKPIVKKWFIL